MSSSCYLCLLLGAKVLVLELEVVHAVEDLVAEEIVEHTISRRDYDVSVLQLVRIVIRILRQILHHVVVHGPEHVLKLLELLESALLLEDLELFLARQDGQLVGDVEGVLLLVGLEGLEGRAVSETNQDKPAVPQIRQHQALLIPDCHEGCRAANG